MLDANSLASFRERLLQLRHELQELDSTSRDAAATVELDQTLQGRLSRMDALQGQAMSQALYERRQLELQKITSALQRIESGDYGYCVSCGEAIALRRLEFEPAALLCIGCASQRESE
ncbi:MAG: TraR/DksA family transcriptional regulator [Pseudomonadota bacterium]|nr:MAG: TraR/DksA family transcriptional regulator [Pseudomonadota bacterium]